MPNRSAKGKTNRLSSVNMFTGQEIMDSDRQDRNAEGRKNAGTGQGNDEENGETAAVFFVFYDVFGLRMAV